MLNMYVSYYTKWLSLIPESPSLRDNNGDQKCHLAQNLDQELKIELSSLPPNPPNLNLIGRLWEFAKNKVLYSKYYDTFENFKHSIQSCLNQTHTTCKKELDSSLTLKLQTFKKTQIMTL